MYTAINLCKKTQTINAYGDLVTVWTKRQVYAEEMSVGMSEVYQAMAVGYKPEVKFRLENFLDYQGEEVVEYAPFMSSDTYILRVLRTYRDGDRMELVCYQSSDNPLVEEEDNGSTEAPSQGQLQEGED